MPSNRDNNNNSHPPHHHTGDHINYPPIRPRGDPDEHRQAMEEEHEIQHSQVLSERRRRNTQAAARMRERQRERERSLSQRRDELMERMTQLKSELSALRSQRRQEEGKKKQTVFSLTFWPCCKAVFFCVSLFFAAVDDCVLGH